MDKDYVCGEQSDIKDWTQIRVSCPTERLDDLVAIMSMVNNNLMIEDLSDIDLKTCYGDLIDESILNADKTVAYVSTFFPTEDNFGEDIDFIRGQMLADGINGGVELIGVSEEDWANSWKTYYKPIKTDGRIVIVPQWEIYDAKQDDIIIKMDPGMAFGTGTHETTRLVINLLEKHTKGGDRVLDVGCGSGILAICAAKLGAGVCRAYDIDPMAVRVANENVEINEVLDKVICAKSDLLENVDISDGKYDIVCANIVADIIIRMAPNVGTYIADNGILLASGIISERACDVVSALENYGLKVVERVEENGWCALVLCHSEV